MIIIWDQRDDKKMGDGLFNIHSPFYGLDVRLLHEKFNHNYHPFILLPSIIPFSSFHDASYQISSSWTPLAIVRVKAIPFHQPGLLLTCELSC